MCVLGGGGEGNIEFTSYRVELKKESNEDRAPLVSKSS